MNKKDFRKLLMLLADFGNLISKEDWKSMVIIMKKILSLFETEPNEDAKNLENGWKIKKRAMKIVMIKTIAKLLCVL